MHARVVVPTATLLAVEAEELASVGDAVECSSVVREVVVVLVESVRTTICCGAMVVSLAKGGLRLVFDDDFAQEPLREMQV